MSKKQQQKERYANAANKHIAAAIDRLYKFESEAEAAQKLETIKKIFTTSNQTIDDTPKPCTVLWIKDYEVMPEEEKQGFMGNYAFVTIEEMANGIFTLSTTKLETELKYHPRQKRYNDEAMPNWGHPILRSVKKQKIYSTLEAVSAEFDQLHSEYPQTTVPSRQKLYVMIYSRADDPKKPVKRYVFEIKNAQGGGFTIDYAENEYDAKSDKKALKPTQSEEPPQGHFTSLLDLRRKKKAN